MVLVFEGAPCTNIFLWNMNATNFSVINLKLDAPAIHIACYNEIFEFQSII